MGKKKVRQKTIRYIYEGKLTEKMFFHRLHQCFPNTTAQPLNIFCGRGGTADSQVSNTLRSMHFNKICLILDEDFQTQGPISKSNLRKLEKFWKLKENELDSVRYRDFVEYGCKHKPLIIFSNPSSIEGIILQILGKSKEELEGKTTNQLKSELSSYISQYFKDEGIPVPENNEEKLQIFFKAKLSLERLKAREKDIKELKYILEIFE